MEFTYIDRIKHLKSQKKITNEKLSELTGIPMGTLSKILAGISDSPKFSNVVAICAVLECSVDYILTGVPENHNNYTLENTEIFMIENYRKLDQHGKELTELVLNKELERVNSLQSATTQTYNLQKITKPISSGYDLNAVVGLNKRTIELYDLPVSAGTGVYLTEMDCTEIKIPDNYKTKNADYALRIQGNSMLPKYKDRDVLLVEESDVVEYGELGIFILDGDGYFKKFAGDRLVSLNAEYGDIMLKDYGDVTCCGKVIGKLKSR